MRSAAADSSSAVFLTAPVIASFTIRELLARRWTHAVKSAGVSVTVILVLEIPFLVNLGMQPGNGVRPVAVVNSVSYTLIHPHALRPVAAFRALVDAVEFILLRPWTFQWSGLVLVAGAAVTAYRTRRDLPLVCVTVVPLVCAVAGFSLWQLRFDHYWFLVVAPSAALTMALAITAWRPAASVATAVVAALAVLAQPSRLADAMTIHRLPVYAPLARGSQEIRRRTAEVRWIETEFDLPASTDRTFLYQVLGGRVTPTGRFTASISRTGSVVFKPVPASAATGRAE